MGPAQGKAGSRVPLAGKALILATRPFAADSTARSWWHVLSTLALLAACFAGALLPLPMGVRLACMVLEGLLVLRTFVIYHDQQHHAILPRSRAARWIMWCVGLMCLSPSSVWRSSHDYHHKHNSKLGSAHIGSFPVMTSKEYLRSSRGRRAKYLFMRHPLTILCGYAFVFFYGMCAYPFLTKPAKHYDGLIAIALHAVAAWAIVAYFGWAALFLAMLVPHFIASAIGTYLFYAQHNFPGVLFFTRAGWAYERAAIESSSFLRTGPAMGWFTGNIGYHHIHHLNSRIPFYRLPEAMEAIPELAVPRSTSLSPADIRSCLRLKLWDADSQRMVTVRECLAAHADHAGARRARPAARR